MRLYQISLFLVLMQGFCSIMLTAQPPDHPPIPQIDRTDNAEDIRSDKVTAPKPSSLGIDFSGKQYYKLTAIKAVDINHKHTDAEMAAFAKEAQSEFAKTDFAIDWEASKWYMKSKVEAGHEIALTFKVAGQSLTWLDCKKCQDASYTIIEATNNTLVLQLLPQDENQLFVYQFYFTK